MTSALVRVGLKALLVSCFFTVNSSGLAFGQDSESESKCGPAPKIEVDELKPLKPQLTRFSKKLERWLRCEKPEKEYRFVVGTGILPDPNKNSTKYLQSMGVAYRSALLDGYVNLAQRANEFAITDKISQADRQGDKELDKKNLEVKCYKEASQKYQLHLAAKEREEKAEKAKKESTSQQVLDLFKSDERLEQERVMEEQDLAAQEPEPDFIYSCTAPGNLFSQVDETTRSITDVLRGTRITHSYVTNDFLGLVMATSTDSVKMANDLREQRPTARTYLGALDEITLDVEAQLSEFEGSALDLVGTRMLELSNGEWALYAFGAAQISENSQGGFQASRQAEAAYQKAERDAMTELARFSGIMVTFDENTIKETLAGSDHLLTINMTEDTMSWSETDAQTVFGEIMESAWSGKSKLNLRGSEDIYTDVITDGDIKYALHVVAWSRDLLGMNSDTNDAYDNVGSPKASNQNQQSKKPAVLRNDW